MNGVSVVVEANGKDETKPEHDLRRYEENVRSYGVGKIGSVNDTTHRAYSLVFKCGKVLPQGERREQAAEEFTGALLPTNNKLALRW